MRKVWIIIFIGCISSSYSQENWILYPRKEKKGIRKFIHRKNKKIKNW